MDYVFGILAANAVGSTLCGLAVAAIYGFVCRQRQRPEPVRSTHGLLLEKFLRRVVASDEAPIMRYNGQEGITYATYMLPSKVWLAVTADKPFPRNGSYFLTSTDFTQDGAKDTSWLVLCRALTEADVTTLDALAVAAFHHATAREAAGVLSGL